MRNAVVFEHFLKLALRVGLSLIGSNQHVQRKQGRKQGTIHLVIEDKFMNQNLSSGIKGRHGFGHNRFCVSRPFPVQDMRKPDRIISLSQIRLFIQITSRLESNSFRQVKIGNGFFSNSKIQIG
mgnify:CR=1 FL=1